MVKADRAKAGGGNKAPEAERAELAPAHPRLLLASQSPRRRQILQ